MREIIRLNPTSEDLKAIHNTKTAFLVSKIAEAELKEKSKQKKKIIIQIEFQKNC